jgi:hypothetical protein
VPDRKNSLMIFSPHDFFQWESESANNSLILFYDEIIFPRFDNYFTKEDHWVYPSSSAHSAFDAVFYNYAKVLEGVDLFEPLQQSDIVKYESIENKFEPEKGVGIKTKEEISEGVERFLESTLKKMEISEEEKIKNRGYAEQWVYKIVQDRIIAQWLGEKDIPAFSTPSETGLDSVYFEDLKNNIIHKCNFALPNFEKLEFEEVLEVRQRFKDLLIPARQYLAFLTYEIAKIMGTGKLEGQDKWVNDYISRIIKPIVNEFVIASQADRKVFLK